VAVPSEAGADVALGAADRGPQEVCPHRLETGSDHSTFAIHPDARLSQGGRAACSQSQAGKAIGPQ